MIFLICIEIVLKLTFKSPNLTAMNIQSLFKSKSLTPSWSFSAEHTLWRILFSDTGFIVGEDRDAETKKVSFFCVNGATGDVLWQNLTFADEWWIGIEAIVGDKVFFHGYAQPDSPRRKRIIAVDLGTGKQLWENKQYALFSVRAPYVYGYRDMFEKRLFYKLEEKTGAFVEELHSVTEEMNAGRETMFGKTDFLFPQLLTDDVLEKKQIETMIAKHSHAVRGVKDGAEGDSVKRHSRSMAIQSVEFARANGKLIYNIHSIQSTYSDGKVVLQNALSIIDEQSEKQIYFDILNSETPYPVPDSFFVDNNFLYYIKEKKTLIAVII